MYTLIQDPSARVRAQLVEVYTFYLFLNRTFYTPRIIFVSLTLFGLIRFEISSLLCIVRVYVTPRTPEIMALLLANFGPFGSIRVVIAREFRTEI